MNSLKQKSKTKKNCFKKITEKRCAKIFRPEMKVNFV